MFKSSGQTAIEVLSATDTALKHCKASNRFFDKSSRSYVLSLETPVSKVSLPSNDIESLRLTYPYLLLQVLIPTKRHFTIELKISDSSGGKRRLQFSTSCKDQTVNLLSARLSIEKVKRSIWLNLCIHLVGYVQHCFPNTYFRTLDKLEITSFCKVRKIVSLRNPIWTPNCIEGAQLHKSLDYPLGVDYINQNLSPFNEDDISLSDDKPNLGERLPMKTTVINLRDAEDHPRYEPRTASPSRARHPSSVSPLQRNNNSAPSKRNLHILKLKKTQLNPINARQTKTHRDSVRHSSRVRTDTLPPLELHENKQPLQTLENSLLRTLTSFNESSGKEIEFLSYISKHARICSETINIYSKYDNFQPDTPRSEIEEDMISEIIDASQNGKANIFDSPYIKKHDDVNLPKPSFYEDAMKTATQHRPFTPPFRGIDSHYASRQSVAPNETPSNSLFVL